MLNLFRNGAAGFIGCHVVAENRVFMVRFHRQLSR
jgi:hypothetical protein